MCVYIYYSSFYFVLTFKDKASACFMVGYATYKQTYSVKGKLHYNLFPPLFCQYSVHNDVLRTYIIGYVSTQSNFVPLTQMSILFKDTIATVIKTDVINTHHNSIQVCIIVQFHFTQSQVLHLHRFCVCLSDGVQHETLLFFCCRQKIGEG